MIKFKNLGIEVFKLSHDANDPVGFIFHFNQEKHLHLTDTGYILNENIDKFKNMHTYLIESNYEDEVLISNPNYPFKTKQRILSDLGHLSNEQCQIFLKSSIGNNTRNILYAHASEQNNADFLIEKANDQLAVNNKVILQKEKIIEVILS